MGVVVISVGVIDGSDVEYIFSEGTWSASSCGIEGVADEGCVGAIVGSGVGALTAKSVGWSRGMLLCMGGVIDGVTSRCKGGMAVGALSVSEERSRWRDVGSSVDTRSGKIGRTVMDIGVGRHDFERVMDCRVTLRWSIYTSIEHWQALSGQSVKWRTTLSSSSCRWLGLQVWYGEWKR